MSYCYDRHEHEREARRAAQRGYLRYDERQQYERGSHDWDSQSCDRIFHDTYEREQRRLTEHREEERREQEAAERRAEARREEERRYWEMQEQREAEMREQQRMQEEQEEPPAEEIK